MVVTHITTHWPFKIGCVLYLSRTGCVLYLSVTVFRLDVHNELTFFFIRLPSLQGLSVPMSALSKIIRFR